MVHFKGQFDRLQYTNVRTSTLKLISTLQYMLHFSSYTGYHTLLHVLTQQCHLTESSLNEEVNQEECFHQS